MKLVDLETRIDVKVTAGVLDQDVRSVTQDSRDVEKGSLFVALPGSEVDGHEFIGQALERGANALLVENLPGWVVENGVGLKVGVLVVPDTRKALAIASSFFNGEPSKSLSVTGITGTNGKTTVSYLVDGIFLAAGFSVGLLGTIENRLGKEVKDSNLTTPDASEIQKLFKNMVERRISHCVMEVSSHALEQDRTWGTRFKSCVFTNLTHDHLDYHKSMKSYLHAKEQLFTAYKPECSIVNIDDPAGASIARKVSGKLLTYGLQGKADLTCDVLQENIEGIRLVVGTPEGKMEIRSPLIGRHNAYNILGAVGVALHEGIPKEQIVRGIESLKSVPGRLERVDEGQNFAVLVDYAHTDDALKNVLSALRHLAKKRIITLFGCGGNRDKDKREKMAKVAVALSDYVVITSDNPRNEDPQAIIDDIEKGIPTEEKGELGKMQGGRHTAICDRRLAIEHGLDSAQKGDIVLIAGKGHEEYQIIGDEKIHFDDREVARNFLRSTA